jgi:hypothetical protein
LKGDPTSELHKIMVAIGLKQGCPLSPLLFSIYFDRLYHHIEAMLAAQGRGSNQGLVTFLTTQLFLLVFADDIVVLATTYSKLTQLFGAVHSFCGQEQLVISEEKTKLLVCGDAAPAFEVG